MRHIKLYTNFPKYANDICDEIRLFFEDIEIELIENIELKQTGYMFCTLEGGRAYAQFTLDGMEGKGESGDALMEGDELETKKLQKRHLKLSAFQALSKATGYCPPWGSLTGIRPTKLLRELKAECGENSSNTMKNLFQVSDEKFLLAEEIVNLQIPIIDSCNKNDFDLYIGIPFCKTRCVYCSFTAYEIGKGLAKPQIISDYTEALLKEIKRSVSFVKSRGYKLRSLYIGGGTPTSLSCDELERVLAAALNECGGFGEEFTVEAGRPDTIDSQKLRMMKRMGVNRISINPQSMNQSTLDIIGRSHSPEEIEACVKEAQDIGFNCINMDTIIGLPLETVQMVENTMEKIKRLSPENLTVHTLAIKRSSALKTRLGELPLPSSEEAEAMIKKGEMCAREMGMKPYYMYRQKYMRGNLENVGYCLKGKESIYNIDIMEETTNILAIGAGAISKWLFDSGKRLERLPNPKDLPTYIAKQDEQFKKLTELI